MRGVGLAILVVFVGAQLVPAALLPDVPVHSWMHVVLYGTFVIGAYLSAKGLRHEDRVFFIVGIGIVLAFVLEALQASIPGRHVDGVDVVANMVGLTAGVIGLHLAEAKWGEA